MHSVRTKPGLIPKIDLAPGRFCLRGNGRKRFAPPCLDRFRIALVSPLQRFLWGQPEIGQQTAHGGDAQANTKLPLNQISHH